MRTGLLCIILGCSILVAAQNKITPYDQIPGNIISDKPTYKEDYPEWGKKLYSDLEIDFLEVHNAFKEWNKNHDNKHRALRRYYLNWARHVIPYVLADGSINLPDLKEYHKGLYTTQKNSQLKERNGNEWTFLGPKETYWLNESGTTQTPASAPWQVNVYCIEIAETDENVLYCGTETGYVNKSIDSGENWIPQGINYNFGGGIRAIAIDHTNENIVFAAAGRQIHKTIDGGKSWTPLLSGNLNFPTDKLKMNSEDSSILFAAGDNGIFRSDDSGITWIQSHSNPTYDIEIHPTDNQILYALSVVNGNFDLTISNDGGLSFTSNVDFPQDIQNVSGGLLAVSEDDPDAVYSVCLTTDDTPLFQDADIIYTGTASLYKSSNGGQSFNKIGGYGGSFPIHPDVQDLKILDQNKVWCATDGGLSFSNDNFSSDYSAKINGLVGSDMWGFDQSWNEDLVVGGRYHNGNTSIADFYGSKALRMGGAESPTGWIRQGRSRHVAFNDLGAGWILPRTAEGNPEGRFTFSKFPNMDEYGGRRSNIVFHTNYFGHMILGEGTGIWKSTDGAQTYELIYDFNDRVRWLQSAYSNSEVMYVDIVNRGLHKSEDGGYTWEEKNALTSFPNGNSNWAGRLFIAISPTDENTIYACLQNGTWSSDLGKIFKSTDGGDSWEDWTADLNEYTKSLLVQPDEEGNDLVYLFTNARDKNAKVLVRKNGDDNWSDCSNGYPSGFHVNLALPFYRDSKLRVSGNGGIWETDLANKNYQPIVNPWVEKKNYNCYLDTVYFEDHSIMNHEGVTWNWQISPEPLYISDPDSRNPKVVLGAAGSYDVVMTILKGSAAYSRVYENMISATSCPSITDCSNPADLPKEEWQLIYADSEETVYPGLATMAFDDDPNTIWHTRWTSGNDTYPHEIIIDLGEDYLPSSFIYLPRQDGGINGTIKDYELYLSDDLSEWGEPVSEGSFENSTSPKTVSLAEAKRAKYMRLKSLSEVNDNIWTSAAELTLKGCLAASSSTSNVEYQNLVGFPIPSSGLVKIAVPHSKKYAYTIVDLNGKTYKRGEKINSHESIQFDLSNYPSGLYIVLLTDEADVVYKVKVVKN